MSKRSGKFYYKNESEVMEMLGMHQVPGSGNGWISKEDGENDKVLCQLKSTDAQSISIKKLDIDKLILHALTSRKLPVFAVQFLQSGEVFLLVRPLDLLDVSKYLETGVYVSADTVIDVSDSQLPNERAPSRSVIRSSTSAKVRFNAEQEKKYKKKVRSAK